MRYDDNPSYDPTKSLQMFQPAYTMLGHNWLDTRGSEGVGYVRAVGTLFPRELLHIMPDMQRIVRESFDTFASTHMSDRGKQAVFSI